MKNKKTPTESGSLPKKGAAEHHQGGFPNGSGIGVAPSVAGVAVLLTAFWAQVAVVESILFGTSGVGDGESYSDRYGERWLFLQSRAVAAVLLGAAFVVLAFLNWAHTKKGGTKKGVKKNQYGIRQSFSNS